MIVQMTKIQILGVKKYFFEVISAIYRLGVLHIVDFSKEIPPEGIMVRPMEINPRQKEQRTSLENLNLKLSSLITAIEPLDRAISKERYGEIYKNTWREDTDELIKVTTELTDKLDVEIGDLVKQRNELQVELSLLSKYEPVLKKIQPLARQVHALEDFRSIALLIDRKYASVINVLEEELNKVTNRQCQVFSIDVDEESTAAIIVFNRFFSDQVHKFLAMENVNEIRLPQDLADKPFDDAYKDVQARLALVPGELKEVQEKIERVADQQYVTLLVARDLIQGRLDQLRMVPKFGETRSAFLITGWVPNKEIQHLKNVLAEEFGPNVVVTELEISHHEMEENAPVVLENVGYPKAFEFIYNFIKPPKYGSIDPTMFTALGFPFIFGMMLGDAGYGLILMFMAMLLRKKLKQELIANVVYIVMFFSGISSVIWGIVYFEFFGNIPELLVNYLKHVPLKSEVVLFHFTKDFFYPITRLGQFKSVLLLVLIFGAFHLCLGLTWGIINAFREKASKHMLEKMGLLMFVSAMLLGFVMILLTMGFGLTLPAGVVMPFGIFMVFLFVTGIIFIAYGGGIKGIIEIFGTFGNVLSYARILAVGLASVVLALVANELAIKLSTMPLPGYLKALMTFIGIMFMVFLHALNIVIGAFSPSIHSLRLHLVECFTKFYEATEIEYTPFRGKESI